MTTQEPVLSNNPITSGITRIQKFASAFIIPASCVLCEDQIVKVMEDYILLDFIENGEIKYRPVKFFNAYQKGFTMTIVVVDLESEELLKRSHPMNSQSLPCDWILIDAEFLFPKPKEHLLKDFRDRK